MTTILSVVAVGRLAERSVRQAGEPVVVEQVLDSLVSLGVAVDRAEAGIRLATTIGRLESIERDGRTYLRIPGAVAA